MDWPTLPIVVHIGFPKTGTTTHQNHLFAKHSQIHYLGKPYKSKHFETELHRLIKEESTTYQPDSLKEYLASPEVRIHDAGKKVLLVSDEIMVSVSKVRDKGMVAQRIKDVFSPCKILITLRNQFEILQSSYISGGRLLTEFNVPKKYRGRFVGFEDWLEHSYENLSRSHVGNFIFFNTVDYYARLFGKSNVLVLLFEEFIYNKEAYIKKLAEFLNIDAQESLALIETAHDNERIDQSRLNFEHWVGSRVPIKKNRFIFAAAKISGFFSGLFSNNKKARVLIPGIWLERLKSLYSEGNRKLMKEFDLPLDRYDYPV
jgi:hypothetical protein